jgi:arginine exporter protein ArgO
VTEALVSGLLAGYGVAIPVGAIGVLILGLSARTSLAVGAGAGLGAATADGMYATFAALGGAAVAGLVRTVATPLRWLAAAVLLAFAARTAAVAWWRHRDPDRAARPDRGLGTPGRAYLGLLGLTLLNPATVVYFSALVLGRQAGAARSAATSAVFVLAAFVASASWQLLLAAGGSAVGRLLASPGGRLASALVSSALIALLAIPLVVR